MWVLLGTVPPQKSKELSSTHMARPTCLLVPQNATMGSWPHLMRRSAALADKIFDTVVPGFLSHAGTVWEDLPHMVPSQGMEQEGSA